MCIRKAHLGDLARLFEKSGDIVNHKAVTPKSVLLAIFAEIYLTHRFLEISYIFYVYNTDVQKKGHLKKEKRTPSAVLSNYLRSAKLFNYLFNKLCIK